MERFRKPIAAFAVLAVAVSLAGCATTPARVDQEAVSRPEVAPKETTSFTGNKLTAPIPEDIREAMSSRDMKPTSPILMRIFKEEGVLEVWKRDAKNEYGLLVSYPICKFSGELGPKFKEGDRQAPEGFYSVNSGMMHPGSSNYLAFNTGFPNAFDRSHGRTGTNLMVHGGCTSSGCYAVGDDHMREIYSLAREAFKGGQRDFQLQAFPFRMTDANMLRHAGNKHIAFWRKLKEGYDLFEDTRKEPMVTIRNKQYVFTKWTEVTTRARSRSALDQPSTAGAETSAAQSKRKTMRW